MTSSYSSQTERIVRKVLVQDENRLPRTQPIHPVEPDGGYPAAAYGSGFLATAGMCLLALLAYAFAPAGSARHPETG